MNSIDNNDILFFKVWKNIVINRAIFECSRLFIKNKRVEFYNVESLIKYGDKEFITTLIFLPERDEFRRHNDFLNGTTFLVKGVLPESGVLKEIDISSGYQQLTHGDILPQGVEIIHFSRDNEIQFSEFPLSVNTITNATLKKPYRDNQIPNNITSLSFSIYIDDMEFYDIILPNSILKLDLLCLHNVLPCTVPPISFIPSSVTDLSIIYNEGLDSNLPSIPTSVTKLYLDVSGDCYFTKGAIPYGVKDLNLRGSDYGGINLSNESLPYSLINLEIWFGNEEVGIANEIQPNSIPNGVLDLKVHFAEYPRSFIGLFPNSLTRLEIDSYGETLHPNISHLPLTITYLKIDYKEINLNK